jgi:hypothetical protein
MYVQHKVLVLPLRPKLLDWIHQTHNGDNYESVGNEVRTGMGMGNAAMRH